MNILQTIWQALSTRHLHPSDRAAVLNPDIDQLRKEQHDDLNRLAVLQARRQLYDRLRARKEPST